MDGSISKLFNIYASFSGKSLVGKNDHPRNVSGQMKNIHPWLELPLHPNTIESLSQLLGLK